MMIVKFRLIFLVAVVVLLCATNVCNAEVSVENVEANGQYEAPESPLFHAASVGNVGVIQHELSLGMDVNVRNDDDWTPLMFAVESNSLHAVSLLLRSGADPNVQDKDGWAPLMFAAHAGKSAAVRLLLEAKANVMLANKDGFGAHSIAQFEGHVDLARTIATEGVISSMLKEDFASMQFFIKDGASVNTQNKAGWTPLIAAISAGNTGVALALLDRTDIDVNLAENDGWTPLMFAANNNRLEVARRLLELNADLSIKSKQGLSAQGIARDRTFPDMVKLFKSADALKLARAQQDAAIVQQDVSPADYTLPSDAVKTVPKKVVKVADTAASVKLSINADKEEAKKKKAGWFW